MNNKWLSFRFLARFLLSVRLLATNLSLWALSHLVWYPWLLPGEAVFRAWILGKLTHSLEKLHYFYPTHMCIYFYQLHTSFPTNGELLFSISFDKSKTLCFKCPLPLPHNAATYYVTVSGLWSSLYISAPSIRVQQDVNPFGQADKRIVSWTFHLSVLCCE